MADVKVCSGTGVVDRVRLVTIPGPGYDREKVQWWSEPCPGCGACAPTPEEKP